MLVLDKRRKRKRIMVSISKTSIFHVAWRTLLFVVLSTTSTITMVSSFMTPSHQRSFRTISSNMILEAVKESESNNSNSNSNSNSKTNTTNKSRKNKKQMTIAELRKEIMKNMGSSSSMQQKRKGNNNGKYRRTRKRVENPQQTYMYAYQRSNEENENENNIKSSPSSAGTNVVMMNNNNDDVDNNNNNPWIQAKQLGMKNPFNQHCDAIIDTIEPQIIGQIRVADDEATAAGSTSKSNTSSSSSSTYAYLIVKPAGWSILGGVGGSSSSSNTIAGASSSGGTQQQQQVEGPNKKKKNKKNRITVKEDDGSESVLEYDESDILACLNPEERALLEDADDWKDFDFSIATPTPGDGDGIDWYDTTDMTSEERERAGIKTQEEGGAGDYDFYPSTSSYGTEQSDEDEIYAMLNEKEREEYVENKKREMQQQMKQNPLLRYQTMAQHKQTKDGGDDGNGEGTDKASETFHENLKRIEQRLAVGNRSSRASFDVADKSRRPSVVAWLKERKAEEGTPIRGGKYWTAVAGATEVDDSGLVLLCPKSNVDNVFVDFAEYVTVVGNGQFLAPLKKQQQQQQSSIPDEAVSMRATSRVRKGREGDSCQTVHVTVQEHVSTCSSITSHVQDQFDDGIRGDPGANPFDRRAPRRLIHCKRLVVSSLVFDDDIQGDIESLPDDIAILSERLNHHKYVRGSFLGRSSLRDNPLTTAYREINGAADGFPGWTVDRYDKWLFVQHDTKEYKGPLPSIHDGNTAGVYYLPANPDRSAMGSEGKVRPTLLEGQKAPDIIPILENGVTYHVSLDKDLSTGIFLDQRPHRAWLTRNCNENTHVLNCFAHCGAFSIAAANAGASTVSLDLNQKWLNRVQTQLEANGIEFNERHDCIYGDCKLLDFFVFFLYCSKRKNIE